MSKGLEAIKEIKNYEVTYPNHTDKPFMVTPDEPDKNRTVTTIGEIFDFDIPLIEKELKALAIIEKYFYSKHIIHDLYCLGATEEEIKFVKEELENDN